MIKEIRVVLGVLCLICVGCRHELPFETVGVIVPANKFDYLSKVIQLEESISKNKLSLDEVSQTNDVINSYYYVWKNHDKYTWYDYSTCTNHYFLRNRYKIDLQTLRLFQFECYAPEVARFSQDMSQAIIELKPHVAYLHDVVSKIVSDLRKQSITNTTHVFRSSSDREIALKAREAEKMLQRVFLPTDDERETIMSCLEFLGPANGEENDEASDTLREIGAPCLPLLIPLLTNSVDEVRLDSIIIICEIVYDSIDPINTNLWEVRGNMTSEENTQALIDQGYEYVNDLPEWIIILKPILLRSLDDNYFGVREYAVDALLAIDPVEGPKAALMLLKRMRNLEHRGSLIRLLIRMGHKNMLSKQHMDDFEATRWF